MKKFMILLMLGFFAINAQAADVNIGVVNLNRALNESDEGQKAIAKLEKMVDAKRSVIAEKEEQIKKLEEEIVKQSSILNEDALKKKKEEREKLMRDYKRMVNDSQSEVEKKRNEYMDEILDRLRKTTAELGKEKGYTLILEEVASGILYAPEAADITDALIQRFNNKSAEESCKE